MLPLANKTIEISNVSFCKFIPLIKVKYFKYYVSVAHLSISISMSFFVVFCKYFGTVVFFFFLYIIHYSLLVFVK